MVKKIVTVKDWKLMQEGKQFMFVTPGIVRRLKDGCLFNGKELYSFGDFGGVLIISEFSLDLIHVACFINEGGNVHTCKCEINRLIKSINTVGGLHGIQIKPTVRRRRSFRQ